ncbi:hypothetical protein CCMA1212_005670 [Trichoderma ghanense]|uniref:Protein kinase domain-containing protein n=1 Tax=Trichoderma ghanense TaxID=65468 RepID=A0ABY2H4R6_9HYPO
MDIKPANFLVNGHGDVVLIDWEQSGAPWYTLAPEANGEWDAAEVIDDNASRLVYTRYQGPEPVNFPRGRPVPQDDIQHLNPDVLHVCWDRDAADIRDAWKAVVMQCLKQDPLARNGTGRPRELLGTAAGCCRLAVSLTH